MQQWEELVRNYPALSLPLCVYLGRQLLKERQKTRKERQRNICLTKALSQLQEKRIDELNATVTRLFQAFSGGQPRKLADLANDIETDFELKR